jgi:chromate reductase, NAD(P)H dehydrogenase (quinone)
MPSDLEGALMRIGDLPVFNQRSKPTGAGKTRKGGVASAQGSLFVTPEHNRSLPTALKNILDWVSRPCSENLWSGKPGAVAGAPLGAVVGTAVAQAHLRSVLGYLNVATLGQKCTSSSRRV